jgi:hypothetical protein
VQTVKVLGDHRVSKAVVVDRVAVVDQVVVVVQAVEEIARTPDIN